MKRHAKRQAKQTQRRTRASQRTQRAGYDWRSFLRGIGSGFADGFAWPKHLHLR